MAGDLRSRSIRHMHRSGTGLVYFTTSSKRESISGGSYDCTSGSVPHTQENASFVLRFSACPSWERTFSLYCVFPIVLSSSPEEKEKLGVGTKMPPEEKYIALSPSPSPTFLPSFVPQQWTLSLTTHLAPSPLSICSVHLICCIRNQVREGEWRCMPPNPPPPLLLILVLGGNGEGTGLETLFQVASIHYCPPYYD